MKNRGREWFIYFLIDPRDGTVRYVGCTEQPAKRLKEHVHLARCASNKGSRCKAWVRQLLAAGIEPEIKVVYQCRNRHVACAIEAAFQEIHESTIFVVPECKPFSCTREPGALIGAIRILLQELDEQSKNWRRWGRRMDDPRNRDSLFMYSESALRASFLVKDAIGIQCKKPKVRHIAEY